MGKVEWEKDKDGFYNSIFEKEKKELPKEENIQKRIKEEITEEKEPEIKKLTKEEKKQELEKFNNDPRCRTNGILAVNKWFFYAQRIFLVILLIAFLSLLVFNMFSFNKNFKEKDLAPKVDVKVDTPDNNVNISNEYQHNIYINSTIVLPEITCKITNST